MGNLFLNIGVERWHLQWSIESWLPVINKNQSYDKSWGIFRLFYFDFNRLAWWFTTPKRGMFVD